MKNLVISNDIDLWSKNEENILLGDWCELGLEKFKSSHKILIVENHWKDLKKVEKDLHHIQNYIWEELVTFVSNELNNYHKTNYKKDYWEILIGSWLTSYLVCLFDRYETIKIIIAKYNLNNLQSSAFNYKDKDFIPEQTIDFTSNLSFKNSWSHWINYNLIKFFQIKCKEIDYKKNKIDPLSLKINQVNKKNNLLQNIFGLFNRGTNFFFNPKLFIHETYMPAFLKLKLLYSSKSLPTIPIKYLYEKTDLDFDNEFRKKKIKTENDTFVEFAKSMVFKNIPKSFVEDFLVNKKKIKKFGWPSNPDNILTSIGQYYNEYFKIYIAEKKLKNCKFLISQHGGMYGLAKFSFGEFFEKKICNKYLSWGWSDSSKVIPLHHLNYNLKKKYKKIPNPKGIIISATNTFNIPNRMDSIPRDLTNTKKYYKNISQFINNLDDKIQKESNIKYIDLGRSPSIKEFLNQNINFLKSKKPIIEQSINYKLVIETLNSTGFLENLYFNVPSILILDESYCQIRNKALKFFEQLKNNKIVFNNPILAAKHINNHYQNINLWWKNKDLQNARLNFCKEFINSPDKNYLSIRNLLN